MKRNYKVTVHAEGTAEQVAETLGNHATVYAAAAAMVAAPQEQVETSDEPVTPPPATRTRKAKPAPAAEETFEDDVTNEAQEIEEDANPEETETEEEEAPEVTADQVRKALGAYVKKLGTKQGMTPEAARAKAVALLKKNFKVDQVGLLKPAQLAEALKLVS